MDKLEMQTKDLANEKYEKLKELFPNAITETIDEEGNVVRAIDKDVLTQEISTEVIEGEEERYQFTWPYKRQATVIANAPISKTLRPYRDESVNFDETENLYIEGDNLEVLKLLQETYLGKVKMIYIDPPYNTGSDFVYNDNFTMDREEYLEDSGQFDEEGNRLEKNLESNGRFHTDWLNMMYPRLKLARNLLSDDGVMFLSIDDNEVANLVKICDEVFGSNNKISIIPNKARASVSNDKIISNSHNYILFYAKNVEIIESKRKLIGLEPNLDGFTKEDNDGKGRYKLVPVDGPGGARKGNPYYEFLGVEGYWRFSKDTMTKMHEKGLIVKTGSNLQQKYYETDAKKSRRTSTTWWDDVDLTSSASIKLNKIMEGKLFNNPKPVKLILKALIMMTYFDKEAYILDFFSGSATTAHATMQLNAEDGGKRKFIMVQLPEETDETSEAYKSGYKNIPEIGKERIRRAGKYIIDENQDKEGIENLDFGFRVLKTDSSNMKDVFYAPAETEQIQLDLLADNIKEDRTPEDLLFQVMLDLGVSLSSKIEREIFDDKEVFTVEDGFLIACFDKNINDETVKAIANKEPYYAVFRDSSMSNDSVATNFEQIFDSFSPQTVRKVI